MPKPTPEPSPIYPLYRALIEKIIPWSEQAGNQHITIARHNYQKISEEELPRGVQVVRRKPADLSAEDMAVRVYDYNMPAKHFPNDGVVTSALPVIACVIKGTAQLEVSNYVLHCSEGNLVIFPPQVPHPDGAHPHVRDKRNVQDSADIFWLYYWRDGIICHICHSRGKEHEGTLTHEECYVTSPQALLCFEVMIEEMAKEQNDYLRIFGSQLLSLLIILRREFEAGNYIQPGATNYIRPGNNGASNSFSPVEDPIARAVHYIRFHLDEPLTIDGLANKYYISRAQFTKRFRDTMGQTFLEFLTEQRLAKVTSLLRDTDWSLETICTLSGLKKSNLRLLLRNHTGLTPLEYRQQSRAKKAQVAPVEISEGNLPSDRHSHDVRPGRK